MLVFFRNDLNMKLEFSVLSVFFLFPFISLSHSTSIDDINEDVEDIEQTAEEAVLTPNVQKSSSKGDYMDLVSYV